MPPNFNVRGTGPGITTFGPTLVPTVFPSGPGGPFGPQGDGIFGDRGGLGSLCGLLTGNARLICEAGVGLIPTGSTGTPVGNPSQPLNFGVPCGPGFQLQNGRCVPVTGGELGIPGSTGITTPAERSIGGGAVATGMVVPSLVGIQTHVCPTFANGKKGILWFSPMTNQIVCLPRGTNGNGFGLVRKNKPRAKPPITAAEAKAFGKMAAARKRVQKVAQKAGLKGCNLR